VENRIESVYQGNYKKFIVDKIDPPFTSPQHYHSHLASLDPKERLGYSPYIYTADSRPSGQKSSGGQTKITGTLPKTGLQSKSNGFSTANNKTTKPIYGTNTMSSSVTRPAQPKPKSVIAGGGGAKNTYPGRMRNIR